MNKSTYNEIQSLADKHFKLYMLMNQWTRLLQDKKSIKDFFEKRNYKNIAIYGFNYVGETLERELRNTNIKIQYIVDRNAEYMYAPSRIIMPTEKFEDVDIMVVTVIDNSEELINNLQQRCDFEVISIEKVIKEV